MEMIGMKSGAENEEVVADAHYCHEICWAVAFSDGAATE